MALAERRALYLAVIGPAPIERTAASATTTDEATRAVRRRADSGLPQRPTALRRSPSHPLTEE